MDYETLLASPERCRDSEDQQKSPRIVSMESSGELAWTIAVTVRRPDAALGQLHGFKDEMKKNLAFRLLAGLAIIVATSSCEYKRQARFVTSVQAATDAWFLTNDLAGKATCHVVFVNRDPQLDVVGIISTNQQEGFIAMIRSNSVQPSRIRFWSEKPTLQFLDVVRPEGSRVTPEKREAEMNEKLLRTVTLKD